MDLQFKIQDSFFFLQIASLLNGKKQGHSLQKRTGTKIHFYPTTLKGCRSIVFTHGVRMSGWASGRAAGKSLSGLYLRNCKV